MQAELKEIFLWYISPAAQMQTLKAYYMETDLEVTRLLEKMVRNWL